MSNIVDSGVAARTMTVTGFPAFEQPGIVQEAKSVRFFNINAGSDIDNAGGAFWLSPQDTYIPQGGMAIEVVFKAASAPIQESTTVNDGTLLFSINGSGKVGVLGAGGISLILTNRQNLLMVCEDQTSRSPTWTPSVGNLVTNGSTVGFTPTNNINLADKMHHTVLNITYDRTVDSSNVNLSLYLDGNLITTSVGVFNYVDVGTNDHRIPIYSYNIGGFEYVAPSGTESYTVRASTRSFSGLIDQVRIFDHPLGQSEIQSIVAGYGLPR